MATTSLQAVSATGAFVRRPAVFRNAVSSAAGAQYPAASGRYVLYVSYACPWASRCLAFIRLKGLEDAIPVVIVDPIWVRTRPNDENDKHRGWAIPEGADIVFGKRLVRDVYDAASPADVEPTKVYSVPVLIDSVSKTIVNNESSEIIRFLNTEFNAFAKFPEVDLYPEPLRAAIDDFNTSIYGAINDGVYRCGFAQSQAAYDEAMNALFKRLEELDAVLATRRWLVEGSKAPTETDIRLFVTLIRFDEVYVVHFKTNRKNLREFPNLHGWLSDLYQYHDGALKPTVDMDHIKRHYYGSHETLNPYGIIPHGSDSLGQLVRLQHGRDKIFSA